MLFIGARNPTKWAFVNLRTHKKDLSKTITHNMQPPVLLFEKSF